MAAAPNWKVYTSEGDYEAACKNPESAAVLASWLGDGATVRLGHRFTVWTEGSEQQPAAESWDFAAGLMLTRVQTRGREAQARANERRIADRIDGFDRDDLGDSGDR